MLFVGWIIGIDETGKCELPSVFLIFVRFVVVPRIRNTFAREPVKPMTPAEGILKGAVIDITVGTPTDRAATAEPFT